MAARRLEALWHELDPNDPPRVLWPRPINNQDRAVVLLGAFDPPTRAHVAIAVAGAKTEGVPAVLCMTKVLLDRPSDELLAPMERLGLLEVIAEQRRFGLALANRGTYIDVHRAFASSGTDATFIIGSDKLAQLMDPSFYPDGQRGIDATFGEIRFLVVPRVGADVTRNDVHVLDPSEVFPDPASMAISSTEVRRRLRNGEEVASFVPPEVALDRAGYTAADDGRTVPLRARTTDPRGDREEPRG